LSTDHPESFQPTNQPTSRDLTSRNDPLLPPTIIYQNLSVPSNKQISRGGAVVSTPDPVS
jgi:hypothetical protein